MAVFGLGPLAPQRVYSQDKHRARRNKTAPCCHSGPGTYSRPFLFDIIFTMPGKNRASHKPRAWLLALLGTAAIGAGVFWGGRWQKSRWLETASLDELAAAAVRDESDVEIFIKLGRRARDAEQWERASRAFGHACELAPDRVECWVGWARSLYEFASYPGADAILSDFIKRHPNDPTAYLERAALRREAKRNDKAWSDINEAVRLAPNNGEAWALKGELCIDMGTHLDAQNNFKKAQTLLPDSPWPLMGLYHSSIELKSLTEAEAAARALRKRFPDQVEGRFYLGEVLLLGSKGKEALNEAISELKDAEVVIKDTPKTNEWHFTLYLLLGRAYYNQKTYPEALKYLKLAVEVTPDNPDALFYLGRTYRALGNEKKAAEVLAEHRLVYQSVAYVRKQVALLNTNPDDSKTRLALARWYVQRTAYKSARVHYEELVTRGQELPVAKKELEEMNRKMAEEEAAHAPKP